jgi:hypothetical protein
MVQMRETAGLHGTFRMIVFKGGELIETYEDKNLIVNGARDAVAHYLHGDFEGNLTIASIAFGTNGTAPSLTDTVIPDAYMKPVTGYAQPETGAIQINWTLGPAECNGVAIREFGLVTEDGMLFSRKIRENPLPKESDISIEGQWTIEF